MGVGAVFISTLALHRLPPAADPPITQMDYLTLALHPIVSFVVFGSIIIRTYSVFLVDSAMLMKSKQMDYLYHFSILD
ncbi:hypothetical protein CPC08DRAFT_703783 [Agrocybe pediades]|nr:hypothetical protein CPC08DRAFT_703783 [Agrocybe pediades]